MELVKLVMFGLVVFSLWYRKNLLVCSWTSPPHLKVSARVCDSFEAFRYFGPIVRLLLLSPLEWQDLSSDARKYPLAHEH